MVNKILTIFLVLMLILPLAAAEIMLSAPKTLYNLGDSLDISATVRATQKSSGFFKMSLICNETNDFYLVPVKLLENEEMDFSASLVIEKPFAQVGPCRVLASFATDRTSTPEFKITDKIDVALSVKKQLFDPGEVIFIEGTAKKSNTELVEGYYEITSDFGDISGVVSAGKFKSNITTLENTKSGNYEIIADVYELNSKGEKSNQGISSYTIAIRQIPTTLEITLNNQIIKPGNSIKIIPSLYDQADDKIITEISVSVFDTEDDEILQKLVKTDEEIELKFKTNATAGEYTIKVSAASGKVIKERTFTVEEYMAADFTIEDDIVTVYNIGNVLYKKTVEFKIGEQTEIKEIELKLGESKQFRLEAPDGEYNIEVNDGTSKTSGKVALTGNAISVQDIRSQINLFTRYPIVWIFLIAVFGMFVLLAARKIKGRNFVLSDRLSFKKKTAPSIGVIKVSPKPEHFKIKETEKTNLETFVKEPAEGGREAEHSLVIRGNKQQASVLSLYIKNASELKKNEAETIKKALSVAKENKAAIDISRNIIIFSPATTRTFKNEITAIKTASKIKSEFDQHNRKFSHKINYGIGVHAGEIVANVEQGKLKYTAVGNTIFYANKLAEQSKNNILFSRPVYTRIMQDIRSNKLADNVYELQGIHDREDSRKFIHDFLERQKKEK